MELQKEDGWCGPAALSYALKKYGKVISQEQIVKETETTINGGSEPWDLKKSVEKHGCIGKILPNEDREKTIEIIEFLTSTGIPVLIDYLDGNTIEDGHYAVIDTIHGEDISLFNPSSGKEVIEKNWLFKRWKDVNENGKVFKNWAMAIMKKGERG